MITDPNQIRAEIKAGSWVQAYDDQGPIARVVELRPGRRCGYPIVTNGREYDYRHIYRILSGPPCVAVSEEDIDEAANIAEEAALSAPVEMSHSQVARTALRYFFACHNIFTKQKT